MTGEDKMARTGSRAMRAALMGAATLALAACSGAQDLPTLPGLRAGETFNRGYIVSEEALAQVKTGNSQDQVLVALGTPTTISTINGDVFYYISERQARQFAFQQPRTVDRNVLAIYFDRTRRVERVANYGMQDGRVFDFISRTTPSGGEEASLLRQIMAGPRT